MPRYAESARYVLHADASEDPIGEERHAQVELAEMLGRVNQNFSGSLILTPQCVESRWSFEILEEGIAVEIPEVLPEVVADLRPRVILSRAGSGSPSPAGESPPTLRRYVSAWGDKSCRIR
jgi:hypothetical protein